MKRHSFICAALTLALAGPVLACDAMQDDSSAALPQATKVAASQLPAASPAPKALRTPVAAKDANKPAAASTKNATAKRGATVPTS